MTHVFVYFNASCPGSHAHGLGPPGAQPTAHPHAQPHQTGEGSLQLTLPTDHQQIQGMQTRHTTQSVCVDMIKHTICLY